MHIDSLSINELLVVVGAMISLPTRSVLSDAVIFIHTRPPPPPAAKYLPEPGASQRSHTLTTRTLALKHRV